MKSKMKYLLLFSVVFLQIGAVQAQCDNNWNFPEDKSTFDEKNVLYSDAVRNSDWIAAKKPHRWILQNAPDVHEAIYINGEKIYKALIEETTDEAKQEQLIDSLMLMYDMRMEHTPCGSEASILERKAYSYYRYNIKKKSELENTLNLFDKAFELNGSEISYYMLVPYMSVIVYNSKYLSNLSDAQILDRYDKIQETIDYQIGQGKNVDKLQDYRSRIDGLLVSVVNVDCDFVRANLGPKFKENPNDIKLAKKIFGFMLNGKCTDDPLWLEAGKKIQEMEPEFGLAKNIGLKCAAASDIECAETFFNQALELTEDPGNKADMYIQLGNIKAERGQKASARDFYQKALGMDPTKREAYTRIGYLYYQSFDDCAGKSDIVQDRAVFLAAFDMFQRAGNSDMMSKSQEQFPSKEEIFTYNYNKGDNISVGCWISTSTVIRSRD